MSKVVRMIIGMSMCAFLFVGCASNNEQVSNDKVIEESSENAQSETQTESKEDSNSNGNMVSSDYKEGAENSSEEVENESTEVENEENTEAQEENSEATETEKEVTEEATEESVETSGQNYLDKGEYLARLEQLELDLDSNQELKDKYSTGVTTELVEAQGIEYKAWDDMLNEVYGEIKDSLSAEEAENLLNKQLNWIKLRDAEANGVPDPSAGTADRLSSSGSLLENTRERCYELVELYTYSGDEVVSNEEVESTDESVEADSTQEEDKYSNKQVYLEKLELLQSDLDSNQNLQMKMSTGITSDIMDAYNIQFKAWDDMLNEIYSVIQENTSEEEFANVTDDQVNWIGIRDSESAAVFEQTGGSSAQMGALNVAVENTRERCYELVDLYLY